MSVASRVTTDDERFAKPQYGAIKLPVESLTLVRPSILLIQKHVWHKLAQAPDRITKSVEYFMSNSRIHELASAS